jgi:hypothetical protein
VKVDVYEPDEIVNSLAQMFPDTCKLPLNQQGFADYLWSGKLGLEQAERKQIREICEGMERVEDQMRRHLQDQPEVKQYLIVEGVYLPTGDGGMQPFYLNKSGEGWWKGKEYDRRYMSLARYTGFLEAIRRMGVDVIEVPHWSVTVYKLSRLRVGNEKGDEGIMQRHVKIPLFHPDPYVVTLMGIKDGGLGPELAQNCLSVFDTPAKLLSQEPETISQHVPGMTYAKAVKLLQAWGRKGRW